MHPIPLPIPVIMIMTHEHRSNPILLPIPAGIQIGLVKYPQDIPRIPDLLKKVTQKNRLMHKHDQRMRGHSQVFFQPC